MQVISLLPLRKVPEQSFTAIVLLERERGCILFCRLGHHPPLRFGSLCYVACYSRGLDSAYAPSSLASLTLRHHFTALMQNTSQKRHFELRPGKGAYQVFIILKRTTLN